MGKWGLRSGGPCRGTVLPLLLWKALDPGFRVPSLPGDLRIGELWLGLWWKEWPVTRLQEVSGPRRWGIATLPVMVSNCLGFGFLAQLWLEVSGAGGATAW